MSKNQMKEDAFDCIMQCFQKNLIVNDALPKKDFRKNYRNGKGPYFYAVSYLLKINIIKNPNETNAPSLLFFFPDKLSKILQGQGDTIGQPSNKLLVPQKFSFHKKKPDAVLDPNLATCKFCNEQFQSKTTLAQHKQSKEHVFSQVKLTKKPWHYENFNKNKSILVEWKAGSGNESEVIFMPSKSFYFDLSLVNQTSEKITLNEIKPLNFKIRQFVQLSHNIIILEPGIRYVINVTVDFPELRAYNFPILFMFLDDTNSYTGVIKELFFEILSEDLFDLRPIKPYKSNNVVIKEKGQIIPGVGGEFKSSFEAKIRLMPYEFTKEHEQIFNSGLKGINLSPSCEKLLSHIKAILDLEEPENSLQASSYADLFDILLYLEEHQIQIDIRSYDTTTKELITAGKLYELPVPELSENRPSLVNGDSVYISEDGSDVKYQGIVQQKGLDKVFLGMNRSFSQIYLKGKCFHVEFGYNRYVLKVQHQAVQLSKKKSMGNLLMNPEKPVLINKIRSLNWFNTKLNAEQKEAVLNIVSERAPKTPYIIFGPPGTGKTTVLVEAILQVRKLNPEKRILISTPSNEASNVVLQRLLQQGPVSKTDLLRFVSLSYTIENASAEVLKFCNYTNGDFYYPPLEKMMNYKVVISTLCNSARLYNMGVPHGHFDYLFIDEAGHATEPDSLIPISAFMVGTDGKFTGNVIMVGDPKQLGPIIHSSVAIKFGLGTSMLERFMKSLPLYQKQSETKDGTIGGTYNENVLTKLVRNYRSHPSIIEISRDEFYDGELLSEAPKDISYMLLGHEVLPNEHFPMIFHNIVGNDLRESNNPSFFNLQEIQIVMKYVQELIGSRAKGRLIIDKDIAVVTPYRKQAMKIKKMCEAKKWAVDVGSVEKLQGQEKLIVIISTVRSKPEHTRHDQKFHLGFLKNPKRFNVAMTRAKALLIVVGNGNLLVHDPLWRKFIEKCLENRSTKGPQVNFSADDDVFSDDSEIQDLQEEFVNLRMNPEDHAAFGRDN